jgi:hypothetical protein
MMLMGNDVHRIIGLQLGEVRDLFFDDVEETKN